MLTFHTENIFFHFICSKMRNQHKNLSSFAFELKIVFKRQNIRNRHVSSLNLIFLHSRKKFPFQNINNVICERFSFDLTSSISERLSDERKTLKFLLFFHVKYSLLKVEICLWKKNWKLTRICECWNLIHQLISK